MEVERVTGIAQPTCWCAQANFSQELLGQLPAEALGQACICATCAQALSSPGATNP